MFVGRSREVLPIPFLLWGPIEVLKGNRVGDLSRETPINAQAGL
jgi:hypothetical protein